MIRPRLWFVVLAVSTIAVGLLVHLSGAVLGATTGDVLGDALWAAIIAWWLGAGAPEVRLGVRSAVAYAICVAVEVSQLYHAPLLEVVLRGRRGLPRAAI